MKEHSKVMKPPNDLQDMCNDLKVCGRREMSHLIRLRHKFHGILSKNAAKLHQEEEAKRKALLPPEDEDAKIDRELE